ncbi:MFS transporter [Actinoplanes siamensis]|uniref:MFS transporter n=1 Tax=Actinoplanes siamensis TaxID=1223317 RepID=A0A919N765_9ACTN|nr:MFS transporter [Actinoplanes siamensis]GIF05719.1 MFS transporter [Actinoplanes siamensis]
MRRNALLFVLISLCSGFGSSAMSLAAGLWILDLTGSAGLAALAGLGTYAPVLAAPWLGALVDRFPRRPLLIAIDVLVSVAILTLLVAPSAAWIYPVLLIRGLSYVLLDAGESALLPAALPPRLLGDVNGWRSSAQEGTKLLAPLAGAALYAWRGPHAVVLLCALLPLLTAGLYAVVRLHSPDPWGAPGVRGAGAEDAAAPGPGSPAEPGLPAEPSLRDRDGVGEKPRADGDAGAVTMGWGSVRDGITTLWREPLRTPVAVAAVAIFVSGLTNAAVLLQLVDGLGRPATELGILSSCQGAGSIVGGLLVGRLLARLPAARVAALGAVIFAAACVGWALPWWGAMIAASVLAGVGLPWTLIAGVTAIQTGTAERLLGRVAATGNMVMFGPITVAIPLGAVLVRFGPRPPLVLGAVVVAVAAALVTVGRRPARAALAMARRWPARVAGTDADAKLDPVRSAVPDDAVK